ncbi:MAG: Uma2 family endonuclease [Gemmataceae bacterium]|nr:Uma2 family endonuclease [Gemmataceae bacterium]
MAGPLRLIEGRTGVPPLPVRRFSVSEYHRLIALGILTDEDRVELLEGWIVPKLPRTPAHDAVISLIHNQVLGPRLRRGWFCRGQSAITTRDSEPEPDLALLRGRPLDYLKRHPGPKDMALVIEVADTSIRRDRTIKARLYARAGIAVYWIVNLPGSRLEVYTEPSGPTDNPAYAQRKSYGRTRTVPLILNGTAVAEIPVRGLLPGLPA